MLTLQHFSDMMQVQGESIDGICINTITAQRLESVGVKSTYANFFSFIRFESGSATYTINSRRYDFKAGAILALTPRQLVFIERFSDDFSAVYVSVEASMMEKILTQGVEYKVLADLMITNRMPMVNDANSHSLLVQSTIRLMQQVQQSKSIGVRESMQASLLRSLMSVISDALQGGKQAVGICHQEVIYRQFIALVASHYATEHSTCFYADRLCVTPVYLARIVRRYSDKTVKDFILSLVYYDAIDMLRYTDSTIGEIAQRLGFPNIETFSKFFRKRNGLPPSKVQRK